MAERPRGAGNRPGGAPSRTLTVLSTMPVSGIIPNPYVKLGFVAVAITLDFIKWWNANKTNPQCQLVEGIAEFGGLAYTQQVVRESQKPYTVRYSHPTDTITGIACVPVSAEIESLEAEVIEGGINCNFVTIRLTPVKQGKWACEITICGKPSTAKPSAAKPSAAIQSTAKPAIEQTGRAVAASSERSSRTIPQCRRLVEGTPEERDALQDMTFARRSREPYDYEYSKPGFTFTGISCLPVSAEIPSPEAEVISGGINCSSVTIRLTPVEEGEWACRVLVCGRLCTTRPSAEVPKQKAVYVSSTNEDNEVPQQAQATNESNDVPQQAQATNENNAVAVPQDARQGDTTESVDMVPVSSQNESGGLMAWVSGNRHLSRISRYWRQWLSPVLQDDCMDADPCMSPVLQDDYMDADPCMSPVKQGSYMDADPSVTSSKVIYRSIIERSTMTPYRFKFHDPAHIITGIACLPKDAETSSPEVEVVRGGVGFKEVEIILKPFEEGNWCCCVQINGIKDNRL